MDQVEYFSTFEIKFTFTENKENEKEEPNPVNLTSHEKSKYVKILLK